jgi:hypothetical protein
MSYARARRRRVVSLTGTLLLLGTAACSGTLVYDEQELAAPDGGGDKTDDPDGEDVEQSEFTLDVAGDRVWSDTGVDLESGEMFSVLASGSVNFGPHSTGPGGYLPPDYDQYNVVSCSEHAGLIGKIGQSGEPFFIGAEGVSVATARGTLYLGVNDNDTGNNSGSFAVRLTTGISHVVTGQTGVSHPATVPFTDSEVDVEAGDILVITASGMIDDSVETPDTTWGPAGKPNSFNSGASIIGCAEHVALLGKIGQNGALFVVGTSYAAPARVSGRLFLGLNDKVLTDEGGKLAASVTLIER